VSLTGWVLWVLDDTISKVVLEVAKEGLTADRILQLITLSAVTFYAVRNERLVQLIARSESEAFSKTEATIDKIRIEANQKISDINSSTSEVIGKLTSRVFSTNKEVGRNTESIKEIEIKSKGQEDRLESIWAVLLILIWLISEVYTNNYNTEKE